MQKNLGHIVKTSILPLAIVLTWLGLSAVGGPYFGRIEEVSSNDMATFLPSSSESTKVNEELMKFRDSETIPAIIVFESSKGELTQDQKAQISEAGASLKETGLIEGVMSPAIISDDKKAAIIVAPLSADGDFVEVIPELRTAIEKVDPDVTYKFTGPAAFAQDINKAFAGIDGLLLVVALSVVFVILLVVYRSPILPIVTLLGAMFALSTAILVVWYLAKEGIVQLNGQVQGILFILVIGAATDYALLYISRYREELTRHVDKWQATKVTLKTSWEPIVAAGGTVILGLLCLLASDLASNKALGPVGGLGIVFAILSALTFLPSALLLLGKNAFWPKQPEYEPEHADNYQENHKAWYRIGDFVGRHPRRLWVGFTALLILACLFIPQLKADGVAQTDFIVGESEARDGQRLLDKHFPAGSGSPAYVVVAKSLQSSVVELLEEDRGVESVSVTTTDPTLNAAPVGRAEGELKNKIERQVTEEREMQLKQLRQQVDISLAGAPDAAKDQAFSQAAANIPSVEQIVAKAYPFAGAKAKVVEDKVLLQATLKDSADSLAARSTIQRLRDEIHFYYPYPNVAIGGVSAIQLDTIEAADHDLRVIIPLILVVITIVLMLLLRAIVAPLLLLITTVLSFGATLGISAVLFNNVWKFPGADPSVLIFGFVFLVALGIDYNIFLMTRVREETMKLGVRKGTIKALVVTGGVISSAGIVLSSTFAALYVIPILFLAQIAFIVAFGVLLDTLIVRTLIVPGLTLDIGRKMWWPSKLSRDK